MKKLLVALVGCTMLTGCASIVKGKTKNINLMTSTGSEVEVNIVSANATQTVIIPSIVTVKRDNQTINITVKETDCYRHSTFMVPDKIEVWTLGNLGFTYSASTSTTTDALTGALWDYDDTVVVPVYKKKTCEK